MAKIPIYQAGNPPSNIAKAPAVLNPGSFSEPFDKLSNKVGEVEQNTLQGIERVKQSNLKLGELYTNNSFYAKQPDSTAKAAMAIASAVQDIGGSIAKVDAQTRQQNQLIDLVNRKTAATQDTLDWYTDARKQYVGDNAGGFADAAKQKMQEITEKYGQGLSGVSLARYNLYRLSDYETIVKGAAAQEASQQVSNVTNKTNNVITDAIAMGSQASVPEDVDKILTNMGAQIDGLNPNTDNTLLKKQSAQKVLDGIVRVMGAQRNFEGAQAIVNRYKDLNIVNPTAQANLFTLQRQAAAEDAAMERQSEKDAKEEQKDNQDKLFFQMYSEFKTNPRDFSTKVTPEMISAMVENKQLTPAYGRAVVSELIGAKRDPDPYTLDSAAQHMANGTLSMDWIRQNAGGLDWNTIRQLQDHVTADTQKSVPGQDMKLYVRDMFKNQLYLNISDSDELQRLHTSEVMAQDISTKALKENIPVDAIKAFVKLKYSPEIGDMATPPKNNFFKTWPENTEKMADYYKALYDKAKTMDENDFTREWKKLNMSMQVVRDREEYQKFLNNSGYKDKLEQILNPTNGESK